MDERPTDDQPVEDSPVQGEESTESDPSQRNWKPWAISAGLIVLVVGGAAVAFNILKPFDTERGASLAAIPADAHMVFSVDLAQFIESDRIPRLVETFSEPMEAAGHIDEGDFDALAAIEESLESELGVTIQGDIVPWLGRSMSVAFWIPDEVFEFPETLPDLEPETPDLLLSLEVTDTRKAREFIDVVLEAAAEDGVMFDETELEGGALFESEPPVSADSVSFWLGEGALLIAPRTELIESGISAMSRGSLADLPDYQQLSAEITDDALVEAYFGPGLADAFTNALAATGTDMGLFGDGFGDFDGMIVSMAVVDEGVRFDSAAMGLPEAESSAPMEFISTLPAETIAYFGGPLSTEGLEGFIDQYEAQDPIGYWELSNAFYDMFGVDPFTELLPSIGGEFGVAVIESQEGLLPAETDVPIGLLLSLGLLDPGPMDQVLSQVPSLILDLEGIELKGADPTVVVADGIDVVAYTTTSDAFIIGSSEQIVSEHLVGGGGLASTDVYQRLDDALVGSGMSFFINATALWDLIPMSAEDRAIFEPVLGLGASSDTTEDITFGSLLVLIDY